MVGVLLMLAGVFVIVFGIEVDGLHIGTAAVRAGRSRISALWQTARANAPWFVVFGLVVFGAIIGAWDKISPATAPIVSRPASVREMFDTDFSNSYMNTKVDYSVTLATGVTVPITLRLYFDFQAGTEFLAVYVSPSPSTADLCAFIPTHYSQLIAASIPGLDVAANDASDQAGIDVHDLAPSRQIYIYDASSLSLSERGRLADLFASHGLIVRFRDSNYARTRWLITRTK
jgi:hypothetical protein